MNGRKNPWRGRGFLIASGCAMLGAAAAAFAGWYWATGLSVVFAMALLALAAANSRFSGFAFTIWVFAFAAGAMFFPNAATHWGTFEYKSLIVPLIQIIMLGMGMTLTLADFSRVVQMPRAVIVAMTLQYTAMPLTAFTLSRLFDLEPEVAVGLILIGSVAGGVASNVMVYIAGGNIALSVTMTAVSTMLSLVMTPLAMKLFAGQYVPIETWPMMKSILEMIVAPVIVGMAIHRYARPLAVQAVRVLPFVSMLCICFIIAVTIGLSRDKLLVIGFSLLAACICHNLTGFTLGYFIARLVGLSKMDARTVSIEVGIQNGGMATGIAFNVLHSELAALAAAVFGPWSAVAGSALASWWKRSALESAPTASFADNGITSSTDAAPSAAQELGASS